MRAGPIRAWKSRTKCNASARTSLRGSAGGDDGIGTDSQPADVPSFAEGCAY
jgi:hypothetical protein